MMNLTSLTSLERMVLDMRFWENMLIEEIAQDLGLSWNQVDALIECTLNKLHSKLRLDPVFKNRGHAQATNYNIKPAHVAA